MKIKNTKGHFLIIKIFLLILISNIYFLINIKIYIYIYIHLFYIKIRKNPLLIWEWNIFFILILIKQYKKWTGYYIIIGIKWLYKFLFYIK